MAKKQVWGCTIEIEYEIDGSGGFWIRYYGEGDTETQAENTALRKFNKGVVARMGVAKGRHIVRFK